MYEDKRVDTKRETDQKCPSCGGTMDFNPKTGGLTCPYCGYTRKISVKEAEDRKVEEKDFLAEEKKGNFNWGAEKKTVVCKSCAAVSVYDALQISDVCPYCGSNQVTEEKGADSLAPDGVCPFTVTDKEAGANFHNWLKRKLFCPKAAKEGAKPESFKGVYLPYWTFDTEADVKYTAEYGKEKEVKDDEGETKKVMEWYPTRGTYEKFIDEYPVPATERYDQGTLNMIKPFDTENSIPYKPEYVAGFISERYSVGLQKGWNIAKEDIESILHSEITDKIEEENDADDVRKLDMKIKYNDIKYKYLLLPIWLSSFKYKEKIYRFMVNGRTGKVGGRSPVSPARVALAIGIVIAIILLILKLSGNI